MRLYIAALFLLLFSLPRARRYVLYSVFNQSFCFAICFVVFKMIRDEKRYLNDHSLFGCYLFGFVYTFKCNKHQF